MLFPFLPAFVLNAEQPRLILPERPRLVRDRGAALALMPIKPMLIRSNAAAGFAGPQFVAAGTAAGNFGTTNPVNVPYPAGLAANDIAFIEATSRENFTTAHNIDTPAGWNLVGEAGTNGSASNRHALFWKRLVGTESGTVQITRTPTYGTADQFGGIMSIWRGCVASGTPYEGLATNAGSGATITSAAVTTTGINRLVVDFLGALNGGGKTPPGTRTEDYDASFGGQSGACAAHIEQATAATVAAVNYSQASAAWQVFSLALLPV